MDTLEGVITTCQFRGEPRRRYRGLTIEQAAIATARAHLSEWRDSVVIHCTRGAMTWPITVEAEVVYRCRGLRAEGSDNA